jgi:hypothetical protein
LDHQNGNDSNNSDNKNFNDSTVNVLEINLAKHSTQNPQIVTQSTRQKKVRAMRFDELSAPFGWKQIIAVLHRERERKENGTTQKTRLTEQAVYLNE